MSLPMEVKVKCSICRHKSIQTVMASSNAFGAPDLDLRPPQMYRSTIPWWIQECPKCGYVASELSETSSVDKYWLSSEPYSNVDSIMFESGLAARFYKRYLICMHDLKTEDAFYAILDCAWVCDDAEDQVNAITCRKKALPLLEQLIKDDPTDESKLLLKMDLLRRAEMFERMIEEYKNISFSDAKLDKIRLFQLDRAQNKDTECYTTDDVNRE